MPLDLGDRYSGCSLAGAFTTVNTCGIATSIAGTPGNKSAGNAFLVCWKTSDAWSCSTAGIAESFNCKGVSGWHGFSVNTNASPTFYSCGHDYILVLHGGTLEGSCISYYTIATFSLKNRAALRPTIHGRDLDVSAGGEAGLDWANIGSPTTSQGLDCTTMFSVRSVVNTVQANSCSTIFSVQSVLNTVQTNPCSVVYEVVTLSNSARQAIADDVWDEATSGHADAGSTGAALTCGAESLVTTTFAEPTAVFTWPTTLAAILRWLGALSSDCVQQTATLQTLRNRANTAQIATADLTCTATTVHRGSFT